MRLSSGFPKTEVGLSSHSIRLFFIRHLKKLRTNQYTMTDVNTAISEEEAAEKAAKEAEAKAKAEAEAKKDPKDFIIERKQRQLEEARAKAKQLEEEIQVFKPSESIMDDQMQSIVSKQLEANAKVSEFIQKYPSLKEDRVQIERFVNDPTRQGVPVETRILEAVGVDKFIKLGAAFGKEAEQDALNANMGGDSVMTETEKAELAKKKEKYDNVFSNQPFMKQAHKAYKENNS